MKFYGVLSYVWLNPDNTILNNLKDGLIDGVIISSIGYQKDRRYRKWVRRNKKHIPSIMVDHEAFLRRRKNITWSYHAIREIQFWAAHNLNNLGFKDVVLVAPDLIGNEEVSYEWQCQFIKDYEGETVYPFHGKLPDDVEYVGIPKENLNKDWKSNLPHNNYKLHGLGVSPRNMPMLEAESFYSCDATIDSDGWQRIRIEDFLSYDS